MLSIEANDEHRTGMAVTLWLASGQKWREIALRGDVSDALAKTPGTEFFRAAEEVNRAVRTERCEQGFHGAVMLVTEGKDVRPHLKRV